MAALQKFVGQPDGPLGTCPYPVNEPMIHQWCDAMGDRNPSYVDAEFAAASVHGGVVAPPTMLQAWTMRGLRPPTDDEAAYARHTETQKSPMQLLDEAGFTSVVATNCEQEYFRYLEPGDEVTHTIEVESVSPEKKTGLGVGHFLTQLYTYRDTKGEVVGTMRFRILKFRPQGTNTADSSTSAKKEATEPIVGPRLKGGRPRPSLNQDVEFFWRGAKQGRLLAQRCDDCQALRHPPGPGCPHCGSQAWTETTLSGRGEIYSFVRHHHPNIPPFEKGHPVVLVELEEGIRIVSELVDAPEEIQIGQRVEVRFDEIEEALTLPRFQLAR